MPSRKEFPIILLYMWLTTKSSTQVVKEMLNTWDRQYPGRLETMFSAMQKTLHCHICVIQNYLISKSNTDN